MQSINIQKIHEAENAELMDIVNEEDEIIGQMPRAEIYEKCMIHRIVHVMVFNSKGEFGIHKRSEHKSYKGGHWSTAAGGHPATGETYLGGAQRESAEELQGLELSLTNFRKIFYHHDVERPMLQKFLGIFEAIHDGDVPFNPMEVEKFEFFSREQLQEMIDEGEKFRPELLFILTHIYGFKLRDNSVLSS